MLASCLGDYGILDFNVQKTFYCNRDEVLKSYFSKDNFMICIKIEGLLTAIDVS